MCAHEPSELHRVWEERRTVMNFPIIVREIAQTSFACPSQWEGTTNDGSRIYVRFRHGYLRIDVDGTTVHGSSQRGDGVMSYDELRRRTAHLFVWPAP